MILINEQWYEVRDLDDIATIIKEQFNYDLGHKLSELVKANDKKIKELNDEIDYWVESARDE